MVFGSNAPQLREAPGRILAKILAIQCLFYLSLVGFSFIADLIFGGVPSLTNVFTSQAVTFTSPTGIAALIGSVLAAISTFVELIPFLIFFSPFFCLQKKKRTFLEFHLRIASSYYAHLLQFRAAQRNINPKDHIVRKY
jgi:hypothetical protein